MKKRVFFFFIISVFSLNFAKSQAVNISPEQQIMMQLRASYIKNNVPDSSMFDTILKNDLKKFFNKKYPDVHVVWDLLRNLPTQSGVAYPKFYLWVEVLKQKQIIDQGAVRVAAIEKKHFEVTDFVSIDEIRNDKIDIYTIFPDAVCEKIKSRIKN